MKHRDRVLTALNHELPDRCPMQVGFTPEFANRLRTELGLDGRKEHNPHGGGNTYQLERALDEDLLMTSVCWANAYYQADHDYVDEWGVGWTNCEYATPYGKGHYTDVVSHPLADDDAISRYRAPDPHRPELYRDSEWMIREYGREYFIIGATVTTVLETAIALRGGEQLMMDLAADPDLAGAILDLPFKYHLAAAKKLVELGVDWFPTVEASSVDLIETYVANGLGIGVSVRVPRKPLPENVRALPLKDFPTARIGALWRGKHTPLLDAFLDMARQRARDIN